MEEIVRQLEMETLLYVIALKDIVVKLAQPIIHVSIINVKMVPLVNKVEIIIFACVLHSIQEPIAKFFLMPALTTHV